MLEQDRQRLNLKVSLVYDKMNDKIMACQQEYMEYKRISELEHRANECIIQKQQKMLQQMYTELRAVKTCLEVPKFRSKLPNYDFKGMDFKQFTAVFG